MNSLTWENLQQALREKIPAHLFSSLVERAVCQNLTDSEIILSFPDQFTRESFEEKCFTPLKGILNEKGFQKINFQFLLNLKQENSPFGDASSYLTPPARSLHWDQKYTFDSFVVGGSNQFAHAACQAVAKQPGTCYNPLFIFGGAGLGKTHLLKAMGYEILRKEASFKILYITTETFTNELIQAIRMDKMREFRDKYRQTCDVLLLDDIQFLAGKERTQEEFFYTFNYLHELKKQIVMTADRYPKDIQGLEARLQTRFEWGLVADVQPPDTETRIAILKNKAENEQISLPNEVAHYIATKIKSNIRELEGSLHRLQAFSSLSQAPINMNLAQEVLKDITPKNLHEITPEGILKLVALHFNVKVIDLKSEKRIRKLAFPRQIGMYILRKHLLLSFPEIGRVLGGKDHTTVLHAVTKIAELLKSDSEVITSITAIESLIR